MAGKDAAHLAKMDPEFEDVCLTLQVLSSHWKHLGSLSLLKSAVCGVET